MAGRHLPAAWLIRRARPVFIESFRFSPTKSALSLTFQELILSYGQQVITITYALFVDGWKGKKTMQGPLTKKLASLFLVCVLLSPMLPAKASGADQHTTITLNQAVHFIGTDGSDVVAEPGVYSVEAAQEWLRLIPRTGRRDALLIEAQPGIHDVKAEIPIVISTPGTEPTNTDVLVVQLLNPDGTRLVATGTFSGIPAQGSGAAAQTSDSNDALSVTIDRTAQFTNPKGEEVLVPAGTYAVTVGTEQFTLTEGTGTPITIRAMEGSHPNDMPIPYMVFYSSKEGEIPQRHLLALFYPDGKNLQAIGNDPVVTSRSTEGLPSEYVMDPALLTFEQLIHFTAPDGTPVVVQPGTYTAEASEKSIRLIPSGDSQEALLIEARQGSHDTPLEVLLALSLPGTTPKELDFNYLMLLLPNGHSLEATGSYSGVQTRGFLSGAFKKAKQGINAGVSVGEGVGKGVVAVGEGVGKGVVVVGEGVGKGVVAIGKGLESAANYTWKGMKWAYDQMDKAAKLAFCYGLTGSIEVAKVGGQGIQFLSKLADKIMPGVLKGHANIVGKLTSNVPFKNQISKKIEGLKDQLPPVSELNRIQDLMNNPANIAKVREQFSPKNFCTGSKLDLRQLGLVPNFAGAKPQRALPITVAMVPGAYQNNPVQNDWHMGSIVPDGAGLRWTNKTGASWRLTPDLPNQRLLTGPDNPHYAQGHREFKLVISNGQITAFTFAGGTYQRTTAQVQVQAPAQPQLTVAMVPGSYRHNPVQNDWHMGSIVPDGAGFRWTNKAGASWYLTPDLANQRLKTGPDNPYFAQGLREFKLVFSNGQLTGFQFGGGTYLRDSAPPVQTQVMPTVPQVLPQITVAMVPGGYQQNPVQNDWHMGSIVPDGTGLRWTNKAGASWRLTTDLPNQRLLTGPDNPYYAQGHREFKLVISNGQITGFQFGGGTYLRESAQTQSQTMIRSRGTTPDTSCQDANWLGLSLTVELPLQIKAGSLAGRAGVFGAIRVEDESALEKKEDYCENQSGKWYFGGVGLGRINNPGATLQAFYCPKIKLKDFDAWGASIGASRSAKDFPIMGILEFQFPLDFSSVCIGIPVGLGGGGNPLNQAKHPNWSKWISRETGSPFEGGLSVDWAGELKF